MNIKNKTAGHAGIACFSFALKGNRAGSPHFKIVRFRWWEHVTMEHDVAAARIIFGCGVALVQLPCAGVVSEFATSGPELEYHLRVKNKLCDYLVDLTKSEAEKYAKGKAWTRIIWDVTAVAWLLDGDFEEDYLVHSPIPGYDNHYVLDPQRHFIRYVYHVKRDSLFTDLFAKLGRS